MNSSELHEAFRSGVGGEVSRRLSDYDVFRMMNESYRTFVRLTGGIADFTSEACTIPLVAGEPLSPMHPAVLRIMRMNLKSDDTPLRIINQTDLPFLVPDQTDYGRAIIPLARNDLSRGSVRFALIGAERDKVRWYKVPEVDDEVVMSIYRMPLKQITGDGQELDEIGAEHHEHLLLNMYYMAMSSPRIGNLNAAASYKAAFEEYCAYSKREIERYKHKTRTVQYGGY